MLSTKPRPGAPQSVKPVAPLAGSTTPQVKNVPASTQVSAPQPDPDESSQFRQIAFYFGLAFVFTRLSVLPELLGYLLGTSFYIFYIVALPAIGGAIITGGLRRTFQKRGAYYWMAFFGWMGLATVFSSWIGGSLNRFKDYGMIELLALVIAGGLAMNWKEVRLLLYTVAAAAMMDLLISRLFMSNVNGRIQLWENGTISNSNDLASQLLLVLPFLLWVAMDSNRNIFIRIPVLGAIAYGLWVIVGTASRGALLGIMAAFLFMLWRANMRQRVIALLAGAVLTAVMLVALPKATIDRLSSLFGEQNIEADQSSDARNHLFRQSVTYTLQHPLLGVGPDQFSNYQNQEHEVKRAMWHPTHCAWTQVSSECGIPALIFYVLGLGSSILLVNRTYRMARERGNSDIANACFCYLLAMVGFLVSISFLSNAYGYCLPLMVGLAISISVAAARVLAAKPGNAAMLPLPARY